MPAGIAIDSADFYRTQARRLRSELRNQPARLQHSLAALSRWHDAVSSRQRPVATWRQETRRDHVQDLVAAVVQHMDGPILPYPARQALLRQAERAGIANFDANLIIAATQHRIGERIANEPREFPAWLRTLAIAGILQAWIVAGIYWLLT